MTVKHIFNILILVVFIFIIQCNKNDSEVKFARNVDFNQNWRFLEANPDNAHKPEYDDSQWRTVDLPHDWSIEDLPEQDSIHVGPFNKTMENGHDVGYLRGGIGWYRKTFTKPAKYRDCEVIIHFDGVQSQTEVYVNGKKVGHHVYGYTPFYFNITDYLTNTDNTIAVKVMNPEQNSRWFAGAGIYRPVQISYVDSLHIDVWGVFITTPDVSDERATVNMAVTINNNSTEAQFLVKSDILSPDGNIVGKSAQKVNSANSDKINLSVKLDNPQLWDTESPDLYTANIIIEKDGKIIDRITEKFGIRSIDYSAEKGFLLNGKPVLMKGACLHHDNGLLGAAAFKQAEYRKVKIMKENGYNAIRSSHNPPSEYLLNACDELGMLMIDESFDHWHKPKRPNDYHQFYKEWWHKDTRAMVLRSRNHPSVVMWSIGNEIQERADSIGLVIAREAIDFIKSIDSTRPVTMALCGFWDNPDKEWDDSAPAFAQLDIGGYNYQKDNYVPDHEKYPNRIMYGSESVAKQLYEHWTFVEELPYVIGDFVWTGMDYLGESGIGHSTYQTDPETEDQFAMPWPWYVSNCGDIDLIGNKKPQSYYRDVVWKESDLEFAVHEPIPEDHYELIHFWGWPVEFQHWNWTGHEGEELSVNIYSNYPLVRVLLNGEMIAEKEVKERLTATVKVPYEPGELTVQALQDGEVVATKSFQTTGKPDKIILEPERKTISANRQEIAYVNVKVVDENGRLVPTCNRPVEVSVNGAGELLSAGNASPLIEGSLQDSEFNLFQGRGMVILRSKGRTGKINITVDSPELSREKITINAK